MRTPLALAACLLLPTLLPAAEAPAPAAAQPPPKEAPSEPKAPVIPTKPVQTEHTLRLPAGDLAYTVEAGRIELKDAKNEVTAAIFYTAYKLKGPEAGQRPVTFSFNGGPGSSSVWLHLGILGPRRVAMDPEGFAVPPPGRLVDNPHTLLAVSDLVFIDPVSTGFSRAAKPEAAEDFHGLEGDVASVGDFIRRWVTENSRWASPKFLIGESYGTTRAAALALHLQERHGMYLNGVMLVSSVLNFATLDFAEGNDTPYIQFLPSYTAAAWYHKRLPAELQKKPLEKALAEAEAFAVDEYPRLLLRGDALSEKERARLEEQLMRLTGLDRDYLRRWNHRVLAYDFFNELLRAQGRKIGRFDARFVGVPEKPWEPGDLRNDPSYSQIFGSYAASLNDYLRRELKFESELPYEILTDVQPWDYGPEFRARAVNVGPRLRQALEMNPHLRVHIDSGYYDLATPYFATAVTVRQLGLAPELRDNITIHHYEAGHMMYLKESELVREAEALKRFVQVP